MLTRESASERLSAVLVNLLDRGGRTLKKLMLLVSMLAMLLLAAAPAFAQPASTQVQGIVANDSVVQACQQLLQQNNPQTINQDATQVNLVTILTQDGSGNAVLVTNAQNVVQTGATQIGVQECNQIVQARPTPPPPPPGPPAPGPPPAVKTAVLPATGGASLAALGAGALLVGGGLLARRIIK